jgi:hypothetical protein
MVPTASLDRNKKPVSLENAYTFLLPVTGWLKHEKMSPKYLKTKDLLIWFNIKNTRSYIPKTSRKVPPETPGMILATPKQNPMSNSFIVAEDAEEEKDMEIYLVNIQ